MHVHSCSCFCGWCWLHFFFVMCSYSVCYLSIWSSFNRHDACWRCTKSKSNARSCPLDERSYGGTYDIQFASWSNSRHALHVERWRRCKFIRFILLLVFIYMRDTTKKHEMERRRMRKMMYFPKITFKYRMFDIAFPLIQRSIWNGMSFAFSRHINAFAVLYRIRLLLIALMKSVKVDSSFFFPAAKSEKMNFNMRCSSIDFNEVLSFCGGVFSQKCIA